MTDLGKPFFLQALDALRAGDRRGAAALIKRELGWEPEFPTAERGIKDAVASMTS